MTHADTDVGQYEWVDRLAIQDLINRYSDAVTRADREQCEAVFTPDAIWERPAVGLRYDSCAAFLDVLRETSTSDLLLQTPHSSVIRLIGPDDAEATTTVHELMRGTGVEDYAYGEKGAEINFEQYGIYFDDIARISGDATHLAAKVLVCVGAEDPFVTAEQRAAFEEEMRAGGGDWQMHLYGGVKHSFTHPSANQSGLSGLEHDPPAAQRSWRAMLGLFGGVLT